MSIALDPSSLHSGIPTECATANVVADWALIELPGIMGSGFFARRGRELFYFTALHCLRSDTTSLKPAFNTLLVPYRHTGTTEAPKQFIQVNTAFTIEQYRDQQLLGTVDLIACPIERPAREKDFKHLLGRSAKLPASGKWLEEYMASTSGRQAIETGDLAAIVIGFPKGSSGNTIDYAEGSHDSVISTEAVVMPVKVGFSEVADCLRCEPYEIPYGLSGFSGSPVFARIHSNNGPQFTLIGMVITGSTKFLNFLRVGRLIEAIKSDA